jgi:methylase of polypeptide subunit release factors
MLCQNVLEVSFVCIVVGNVLSSEVPLPVTFRECHIRGEDEEEDQGDEAGDGEEEAEEKHCVMHTLRVEVLQSSSGHHIGSLSLIRVTPIFLPEYAAREARALLRPSTKEEYQYVHYPISVIKAIPKALRLSGSSIIGGDRGLVKTSKGLFFYLDQVRFMDHRPEGSLPLPVCAETVRVPIPDKFTKLMSSTAKKRPLSCEGESDRPRTALFSGLEFHVSPDVMTPRPASETLVHQALAIVRQRSSLSELCPVRLLDLGTGSGSLLLSCLHSLQREGIPCSGVGIDISPKALSVARRNAELLSLSHLTTFFLHSFTELETLSSTLWPSTDPSAPHRHFDIILCNPPYSSVKEDRVSHSRRLNEPAIALFADVTLSSVHHLHTALPAFHSLSSHESLTAFRNISASLQREALRPSSELALLAPLGSILIEFGNGQTSDVVEIFRPLTSAAAARDGSRGFEEARVFSDHDGFPRCLVMTRLG